VQDAIDNIIFIVKKKDILYFVKHTVNMTKKKRDWTARKRKKKLIHKFKIKIIKIFFYTKKLFSA